MSWSLRSWRINDSSGRIRIHRGAAPADSHGTQRPGLHLGLGSDRTKRYWAVTLAGYQTGFLVLLAPACLAARGYSRAYWIYLAVEAATSPFLFLGRLPAAFAGMALWGISMGTQESIMRAAAADLIPSDRRATGFGMFHMAFGFAWFLGSTLMGFLYDRDVRALVAFAVGIQVLAIPLAFLANSVLVKERRQNP